MGRLAADGIGRMPQYFRDTGNSRIAVNAEDVPQKHSCTPKPLSRAGAPAYTALPLAGAWATGPADGGIRRPPRLHPGDLSLVSFHRPACFSAVHLDGCTKAELQRLVEKMHRHWTIDRDYIRHQAAGRSPPLTEDS